MKLAKGFFCLLIFSLAAFSQNTAPNSNGNVEYKGRFDLENPREQIKTYKFLDDGKSLLLIGERHFQFWDVENREVLKIVPHEIASNRKSGSWILSPDGKKLVAFNVVPLEDAKTFEFVVSVWDVETGRQIAVFDKEKHPEKAGKFSKDGSTLITTDNPLFFVSDYLYEDRRTNVGEGIPLGLYVGNSKVSFWDGETLEHRSDISLTDVSWYFLTPDGERLFTTQGEKKNLLGIPYSTEKADFISIWNTRNGQLEKQVPIGDDRYFVRTRKMQVSPDGKYLALIQKSRKRDSDDRLLIWQMDEFGDKPKFSIKANPKISDSDLIYSPDGKFVAMEAGGKVQIYELETGKLASQLRKAEMPDLWLANNSVAIDIDEKKIKAFDMVSDRAIYQRRVVYEDYSTTDYTGSPDAEGNYPTATEIINFTRFSARKDGDAFLMFHNSSLEVVDPTSGRSIVNLITPKYDLKKKKFSSEKLIYKAGWAVDGKYIFAFNSDRTAIEIWQYLK
ncbi:MAG: WD40 repeat domain-containing protein [Pyrinomonadaceae bacterium]|nr:WD40 repeat domain-containing protein [Pyrinomonadaceae bacterium]